MSDSKFPVHLTPAYVPACFLIPMAKMDEPLDSSSPRCISITLAVFSKMPKHCQIDHRQSLPDSALIFSVRCFL